MLLILLLVIILSIPSVQTYIAKKVTTNLNETYGTDINIHRLGLNWKGEVDAREVYIADHHRDTLVYASELRTNILSFRNLINGDPDFGNIYLNKAKLYIKTYKDETEDNMSVFADKFDDGTPPSGNIFELVGDDVEFVDSQVKIIDENLENPEVFNFTNLTILAEDFKVIGPEVQVKINELSLDSKRGFSIRNLQSNFFYTVDDIILNELILETENSWLIGDIVLKHGEYGFSDFENNVHITAKLDKSKVATNDLNTFYNEFGRNQMIDIEGDLIGTLNDFTFNDARLKVGSTYISGSFDIKNVLNGDDSYVINAKRHNISTSYYDLRRFMPRVIGDVLPEEIKILGPFNFIGESIITHSDLSTNSNFSSPIGQATTNLVMGNINNFDNSFYRGKVVLNNFDLGKIANTISLGNVTANLDFDGRGFTQSTVNTAIAGSITSFNFEGYNYRNIVVSGNLKNPVFNGDLTIDDPNLKLTFKGLIDVSKEINHYDFESEVEFAELNKLNLIKRDSVSVFAGKIIMDMDGTTVDDAAGTITFKETFYQNEDDDFYFDDFKVTSSFKNQERTIEINSPDIINGKISGKFLVTDIPDLFRNGVGSIYANFIPNEVTNNQYIDYEFTVFNKIVEVFVPQIELGENTRVKGSVSSDESKFKLDFRSPEILLLKNYLGNVNIQVDNDNPLYNTYVAIDSIYNGVYDVIDVSFINKTLNDTLYIRSEFKGGKKKEDLFNMSLFHTINPMGKSVVGIKKSDITYKNKVWYLNENNNSLNKVVFDDNFKNIKIDSLVLNHNNEIIQMAGVIQDSTYKDIKLQFNDVNIGNIVPPVDSLKLDGIVNGRLDFLQKNGGYYPNSTVKIDDVVINDIAFGDLDLSVTGNEDLTKYSVNTSLVNNSVKSISAVGDIDVSAKNPQIRMDVDLMDFNLQAFSPFGGDVITDIRGLASGNLRVSGNYKSPNIIGRINLEESGLKIPYLNTDFDIENNSVLTVSKNKLDIGVTTITDTKYKTRGTLSGNATHANFGDWELHLNIDARERLLVLDTPPDEDELYYGTAFISGTADINGPVEELVIDVAATTEEGTTFKIPLSDTESIGDDSFIRFLSPEEKAARISGETIVSEEVKGLTLDFDLDINDNAEVEVLVDKVNNSTLKGRGAGTLLIRINTLGKFNMWGEFTVIEGLYDFRYGGIIQKSIEVVPGGNINWDGVPERARLDISAKYTEPANPSVLLDNPSFNRDIPVEVIVDLTGEIIQPDLNFRLNFPGIGSSVKSELDFKLSNEEDLQKQALFLIATGSFVNDEFQGTNTFENTLADRVSSLVSELFADEDGKLRVGVDYQSSTSLPNQANSSSRVGITVSTQINERILINGKVGVPVGGVNETAIAGDIEVQWLVNQDGSLRMNFFNRQADLQFIGEDQIFEQGVGMSYSVDFDTFSELVQKLFKKKLTLESQNELPVIPDDNSSPVNFDAPAIKQEEQY